MKKMLLLTFLVSTPCFAFDLNTYIEMAKEKISKLVDKDAGNKNESITLPSIPKIIKNATSTDVYTKKGAIFDQGQKYKNLSQKAKRSYRYAFVEELHFVVYEMKATDEQLASSLNILEKGGSREGVYRSLVLSGEYANLEGYQETPNRKLVEFSYGLGTRFLNLAIKKDLLKKINLYTMKKIMSEKLLEIMDSFKTDGHDLKRWYAVLSSDLAINYPGLWRGKLRTNKLREVHYKWASTVPLQHIKSEVIIKIHKAMNFLQK